MISYVSRLRQAIRLRGGLGSMAKKAVNVYAHEGIGGVALRVYGLLRNSEAEGSEFSYSAWCREFDSRDSQYLSQLKEQLRDWGIRPKVSVIMPVYNPEPKWLCEAIESVRAQIYPDWELCIADDASTREDVRKVLKDYAALDTRIRVVWRSENGHISAATNSAIEIAQGQYLAMLDHDDLLSPVALFWVVEALQHRPDATLIFSDEDKVNDSGERHTPYFKCDLNRDLLLAQNMVTHLAVYRTELVREAGGCRIGFEGSQDYDLMLRIVDRSSDAQVVHVPRVLYHWRVHAESTAGGHGAKPYALHAAKRAIEEHLQRNRVRAFVHEQPANGTCRVEFLVPMPAPLATIIIPTRNAHKLVKTCIESIRAKTDYPNYEILLIDNGSDAPEALAYFEKLKDSGVRVLRDDRPFNYSALNNVAVAQARGEVVVLMNNDIEVISTQWLSELVGHACRPGVGAVGAKLLYPSDRVQHAGVVIGIGGCAGHVHKGLPAAHWGYFSRACVTQNFSAVTGACLAVRREHYLAIGGLNETELKVAFNDIDFCLRLYQRGLKTVFTPHALLYHHESATRGFEDNPEKIARFEREVSFFRDRWRSLLYADPFYSPNLTLAHENMGLAFPPRVSRWPRGVKAVAGRSVGVVIPTLNAGPKWDLVLDSITQQAGIKPRVLVIDSGSRDDTARRARSAGCEVIEISVNQFGHGKTRQQAIDALDCEFVVLMTQDAVLASPDSITTLLSAFLNPKVAVAYGRQLAASDANLSARILREFNYPAGSEVRSFSDRKRLGLKCAFNSNSFAAYRVSMLREVGGFDREAPVGEDILACAALLKAGYQSAYVSTAYVVHSHNYTFAQEYERYLQIGQMHAMRPELLKTFGRPEGEGMRLIRAELKEALRIAPWIGLATLIRAAFKYLGYRRGRMSRA